MLNPREARVINPTVTPTGKDRRGRRGPTTPTREEREMVDLRRYEDYQRSVFGGQVMKLTDDDLAARLRDLLEADDVEDPTHVRRLRAERTALNAEMKRREGLGRSIEVSPLPEEADG